MRKTLRDYAADIKKIGRHWDNGMDTFDIAKTINKPEGLVERHLHEYLHWKRVDNPALYGSLIRAEEDAVEKHTILCV